MYGYVSLFCNENQKVWKVPLDHLREIKLLSSMLGIYGIQEDCINFEVPIPPPSSMFDIVHSYINTGSANMGETSNDTLISLFKYADFIDFPRLQNEVGKELARRMDDMSLEELREFRYKFDDIK